VSDHALTGSLDSSASLTQGGAIARRPRQVASRPVRLWGLLAGLLVLAGVAIGRGYGLPVAALLAICAAVAIGLHNWRWSVYALLVYLPFSGIPSILAYPHTAVPVLAKDFLFVLPAYLGFAAYVLGRRSQVVFDGAPLGLFALLVLLVLGQALNPSLPNHLVGLIGVKIWLFYIPLYFLGYHLVEGRKDLFRLLGILSLAAIIPAAIGIVEAVFIYSGRAGQVYHYYGNAAAAVTQNFAELGYQGGGSLRRVPSTFTYGAQYYSFAASMVAISYAWWRGVLGRRSHVGAAVWLAMLAAVFLSGARAAFLLVPLLVVLIVLFDGGLRGLSSSRVLAPIGGFLLAVALAGGAGVSVARQTLGTAEQELQGIFVEGFSKALATTWTGLGTGIDSSGSRYAFSNPKLFQAVGGTWYESWYVKVVLELGIVGLVLVALLFASIIGRGLRDHAVLRDPRLKAISAAILAFLVWNLVGALKGQYLDFDPINVYVWLLAGVLAKIPALDREASSEPARVPDRRSPPRTALGAARPGALEEAGGR